MILNSNKFRKLFFHIAFGALAYGHIGILTSCTDDRGQQTSPAAVAVTFNTAFGTGTTITPSTRAYNAKWHVADRVGIYMVAANQTLHTGFENDNVLAANSLYITDNTEEVTTAPLKPGADKLYYPADGSSVNFIAYYPYLSNVNTTTYGNVYPVSVGGESEQVLTAIDLLYHTDAEDVSYNYYSDRAQLLFNHQLSKIIINVVPDEDVEVDLSSDPSLAINGMPTTAGFDLATATLASLSGTTTAIIPTFINSSSTESTASWEAIVIPHTAAQAAEGGRVMTFSFEGDEYTFDMPATDDYDFESGKAYTYNFTLTDRDVLFVNNTIANWNDGVPGIESEYELTPTATEFKLTWDGKNTEPNNQLRIDFTDSDELTGKVTITAATFVSSAGEAPGPETRSDTGEEVTWLKPVLRNGSVVFTADANTDVPRTAYIHIKATKTYFSTANDMLGQKVGEQTFTIKVEQEEIPLASPANCYMLTPGETIYIPVSRANQHAAAAIGTADQLTADFLWADNPRLLTELEICRHGANGAIKVTASPGKAGNVGIAVKVGTNVKWSWHIWVPETPVVANAAGWMDRNLGATTTTPNTASTLGFFYQWGRKDPFPASSSTAANKNPSWWATVATSGTNNFNNSITNPMIFITTWDCGATQRWSGTSKTIYDPCPVGYRVPVNNTLWSITGWTRDGSTKHGWVNNAYGGYYPRAGNRARIDGTLNNVNSYGHYWAATIDKTNKVPILYFRNNDVIEWRTFDHYYALSVRCIKE